MSGRSPIPGRVISPYREAPDATTIRSGEIIQSLRKALESESGLRLFPHWLLRTLQEQAWKHFSNTVTNEVYEWSDFDAFVKAKRPRGLGIDGGVKQVHKECWFYADQGESDAIAALRELDRMLPEPMSHQEAGSVKQKASNDVRGYSQHGNSRSYLLAQLKRDHPELAERVITGEISAYAAAIEAGYRQRLIRIDQIDPEHAANMIRKNCTEEFVVRLKNAL